MSNSNVVDIGKPPAAFRSGLYKCATQGTINNDLTAGLKKKYNIEQKKFY